MNNTKIEWCDSTWNPVTGCRHGCEYCHARRIAERFGGYDPQCGIIAAQYEDGNYTLADGMMYRYNPKRRKKEPAPYPFGFEPTLYEYRLDQPKKWKDPRTIFVCSMADLFGDWVPDEWIEAVFEACKQAPQHRYLFLTKNPERYLKLEKAGKLPADERYWYGSTATGQNDGFFWSPYRHTFVSFEPMLSPFRVPKDGTGGIPYENWIILGAETGNRKGKVTPKKEWVEALVEIAENSGVPVFMKDSLVPIVGEENMRRELPWKETKDNA